MRPMTNDILHWIHDGFPDGVPDSEAPALFSVLSDRVGGERAADVLRKLQTEGRLSGEAAGHRDRIQRRPCSPGTELNGTRALDTGLGIPLNRSPGARRMDTARGTSRERR